MQQPPFLLCSPLLVSSCACVPTSETKCFCLRLWLLLLSSSMRRSRGVDVWCLLRAFFFFFNLILTFCEGRFLVLDSVLAFFSLPTSSSTGHRDFASR
ncbi:unnamed protein product [Ixodes pacificus]